MAGEYTVVDVEPSQQEGAGTNVVELQFGSLIAIQAFSSLMSYIPVGYIASRPGGEKKSTPTRS